MYTRYGNIVCGKELSIREIFVLRSLYKLGEATDTEIQMSDPELYRSTFNVLTRLKWLKKKGGLVVKRVETLTENGSKPFRRVLWKLTKEAKQWLREAEKESNQ